MEPNNPSPMHSPPAWPPDSYTLNLTVGAHTARHLRRIQRVLLDEWGLAELEAAAGLALTELVTNVLRHVPDRKCTVRIARQATGLEGEVRDGVRELPLPDGPAEPLAEGGRGLGIVAVMTDEWGAEPVPGGGKRVWFRLKGVGREPAAGSVARRGARQAAGEVAIDGCRLAVGAIVRPTAGRK
ncbi:MULTISPECIES: ATP-binding protein [unclassified Streptomyces]|uniref:ATP-binding protein n=1 Tax=unclassified Streptomyces TaxID=2593676 RepID=UPI00278C3D7F|nr:MULTISPECIES: ATP-binding protein [unclassified Streptomyces]